MSERAVVEGGGGERRKEKLLSPSVLEEFSRPPMPCAASCPVLCILGRPSAEKAWFPVYPLCALPTSLSSDPSLLHCRGCSDFPLSPSVNLPSPTSLRLRNPSVCVNPSVIQWRSFAPPSTHGSPTTDPSLSIGEFLLSTALFKFP